MGWLLQGGLRIRAMLLSLELLLTPIFMSEEPRKRPAQVISAAMGCYVAIGNEPLERPGRHDPFLGTQSFQYHSERLTSRSQRNERATHRCCMAEYRAFKYHSLKTDYVSFFH